MESRRSPRKPTSEVPSKKAQGFMYHVTRHGQNTSHGNMAKIKKSERTGENVNRIQIIVITRNYAWNGFSRQDRDKVSPLSLIRVSELRPGLTFY